MRAITENKKAFKILIRSLLITLAVIELSEAQDKLIVSYPASAGTHGPMGCQRPWDIRQIWIER
jgi:hypothetical protein